MTTNMGHARTHAQAQVALQHAQALLICWERPSLTLIVSNLFALFAS